jgi:hypothetical protein
MTAVSTGALTADTIIRPASERGAVSYIESIGAAASLYDGTTASGILLTTLASGDRVSFDPPVRFTGGLFLDWNTGGTVVVHIV